MKLARKSVLTGVTRVRDVNLTADQYDRLTRGEPVQAVAPHLSGEEREWLINGITPDEAAQLLPPEDEEAWGC